tara:strand:+ start:800 stop:1723 length:924 start_codon:yes stop_codon:yes gene_type:complete
MPRKDKHYTYSEKDIKEIPYQPSTFETVDTAMFDYINDNLNLHVTTNKGWTKTPVIWVSSERAHQAKRNKALRDGEGALILPLVTIERTSMTKDMSKKGAMPFAHLPPESDAKGGVPEMVIARRIKHDKTAEFQNANSKRHFGADDNVGPQFTKKRDKKIVYETITTPLPVWINVTYSITLRTEYQQQMNELLQPFITKYGNINYFSIRKDGHLFECFVQSDFSQSNNINSLQAEERKYETKIEIQTLAYLIGQNDNQDQPKVVIRETVAEVRISRERVMVGDIPRHGGDGTKTTDRDRSVDGRYRE